MDRPNSLAGRDRLTLVHPFTNLAEHAEAGPLVIERGDGVYVLDDEGHRYLEGMAGLWCASLGFSEQRLVEAARQQLERLPAYHLFGGKSYRPAIELAERLLALAPVPMAKALFVNSGSEANDTAVKLVRYFHAARGNPEKRKVIARVRGYHGVTMAAASLTGLVHAHQDFGLPLQGFLHADCPHYYRFGLPEEFSLRPLLHAAPADARGPRLRAGTPRGAGPRDGVTSVAVSVSGPRAVLAASSVRWSTNTSLVRLARRVLAFAASRRVRKADTDNGIPPDLGPVLS
jgi:adenosylmethionine-8-amino-7-oxononanoate aminotransferase